MNTCEGTENVVKPFIFIMLACSITGHLHCNHTKAVKHSGKTRTELFAQGSRKMQKINSANASGATALGALAVGALAFGALAIGALAIGRFVIGRLSVHRSRFKNLEVDELNVGRLHVSELHVDKMEKPENK